MAVLCVNILGPDDFTSEIENALEKLHHHHCVTDSNDLYTVALQFRLLRQHGIKVSCDIFEKFKDGEGKFKESLTHDVMGMLSLYEAAHLGIQGEDILDEAIDFTTTNLQLLLPQLSSDLANEVSHALNRPIRKCLPRLEARHYIEVYKREKSHNSTLLKFAKLDFNRLQQLHQKELRGVASLSKWWKNLDVPTKLPYARDRVVECYFWMMGIYFEPKYSFGRRMMTRVVATLSLLDDTYDNYGTCAELEILTEAIQRWNIKEKEYTSRLKPQWRDNGYANKYAFEWISNIPKIVRASATVCRLMDDITSAYSYIKQHGGSKEEAEKLFRKEIRNAWKDINEECLKPTPVPMPLLERVLNLTRAMDVIYKDEDGYTNSHVIKDYVASLLKDPAV
ncbi:LOW QUALITY PROTEIN: alpha-copaene synthase [Jatropha curcas]|uniref:LOW QUALITY PROTEIN: alpha-copaene synthase n=1 Tax=Jatropha curcas TaxID=180498 RepID=UPI00189474AF|nr:LOW QUALITY PROTEIN: alpha-copaene synthase [Jatropha curcas]